MKTATTTWVEYHDQDLTSRLLLKAIRYEAFRNNSFTRKAYFRPNRFKVTITVEQVDEEQ